MSDRKLFYNLLKLYAAKRFSIIKMFIKMGALNKKWLVRHDFEYVIVMESIVGLFRMFFSAFTLVQLKKKLRMSLLQARLKTLLITKKEFDVEEFL